MFVTYGRIKAGFVTEGRWLSPGRGVQLLRQLFLSLNRKEHPTRGDRRKAIRFGRDLKKKGIEMK